jgi:hypothetical protein
MTISFRCPKCDNLCAFKDRNAGRNARCRRCGQIFIIPDQDGGIPQKIKLPKKKKEPIPGFYRAVFVDSWKLFFNRQNITPFVFVAAVVSFRFFLSGTCCMGLVSLMLSWGWLLGLYLNIIYNTSFDVDELPEIYLGDSLTFVWYIIKPILTFILTMAGLQFPYIITSQILRYHGIVYDNIWVFKFGWPTLLQLLFISGLFLFPVAILTIAVGEDVTLLRPDYLIKPIFRNFPPYLVVVCLLVAVSFCEMHTLEMNKLRDADLLVIAGHLAANLAVQAFAIIAMRAIGLFMRHYSCYFPWQQHDD